MHRALMTTLLIAALPLAGCDRAPSAGDPAAATDAPAPAAPAAPTAPEAPAPTLPAEFVVSTNEPFWQARVEGGEVVLDGPDVDGRRFSIERRDEGDDARVVHARDAAGTISVTLRPGPCQDSMSGAEFPHAGDVTIDGVGPAPGCARPAGTPPPRPSEE